MSLAQDAVDNGNVPAACEFYEVALTVSPNNPDVLEAYAEIMLHHVQDLSRAEQLLRHAVEVNPRQGHIKYLSLAQLLSGSNSLQYYQAAFDILQSELCRSKKKKKQLSLRRELSSVRCAVAELFLTDLCDDDTAEEQCEQAINDAAFFCSESIEVHQLRASLRLSQQRHKEALAELRLAVALTHRLPDAHQPTYESKIELGKLLMQVSPDEGFRFLLEVLHLDDGNAYVWFLLGESARLRRRYDDAARLLKRARMMVSTGNNDAARQVEAAIGILVEEMGGPEAVNQVPNMDAPNPVDYLQPENEEEDEDDDPEDPENNWEECDENSDG